MKTISDKSTRDELIERIKRLNENATAPEIMHPFFGKMTGSNRVICFINIPTIISGNLMLNRNAMVHNRRFALIPFNHRLYIA